MTNREDLENKVKFLEEQVAALQTQLGEQAARLKVGRQSGYLITTPSRNYNGITAGVQFVQGQAFLPDSDPMSAGKARFLEADFHYSVEHISEPEMIEA